MKYNGLQTSTKQNSDFTVCLMDDYDTINEVTNHMLAKNIDKKVKATK